MTNDRMAHAYDWSRVFHAYGTATDTPEVLAGPLGDAKGHLWSAILHQGSVWPATPPVLRIVAARIAESPVLALSFVRDVAAAVRIGDEEAERLRAEVAAAPTEEWTAAYAAADEETQVDLWDEADATGDLVLVKAGLDCLDLRPELRSRVREFLEHPDEEVAAVAREAWRELSRAGRRWCQS
ncbi:hypothetical protein [Streptomyces sp. NPDC051909]|uniref:hypothetical protein n=1 Tax=Streptomyces sp. NPDC051909 TaxID=3154944 RepID=UPI0034219E4E